MEMQTLAPYFLNVILFVGLGFLAYRNSKLGKKADLIAVTLAWFGALGIAFIGSDGIVDGKSKGASSAETIVVMPNKKNLRIAKNGTLAFCIDGIARNWISNENGIVSTSIKLNAKGEPLECYTVEGSIEALRKRGASEAELKKMREAYR